MSKLFLLSLAVPFISGLISFMLPRNFKKFTSALALIASLLTFGLCIGIFAFRPISIDLGGVQYLLADTIKRHQHLQGNTSSNEAMTIEEMLKSTGN